MFDYYTSRALQEQRYPASSRSPRDEAEPTHVGRKHRARLSIPEGLTVIGYRLRSFGRRIQHSTR